MASDEEDSSSHDESLIVDTPVQDINPRVRHHSSLSQDSSNSPEAKKARAEVSALFYQSINLVGWLDETILRNKRMAKGTVEAIAAKLKELRTNIKATEKAVALSVRKVSPIPSSSNELTSSLVDEFARVVSEKERSIVHLEMEIANLKAVRPQASYADVVGTYGEDGPPPSGNRGRQPSNREASMKGKKKPMDRSKSRTIARSRSRLAARKSALDKVRATSPTTVFRIKTGDVSGAIKAKNELWTEVCKKTKVPKIVAVPTRSGDLVLKPQNKESTDILAAMAKNSLTKVTVDSLRRPRVQVFNVDSSIEPKELPMLFAAQNPELGVDPDDASSNFTPIFKRGPRDRRSVHWIFEVAPEIYGKLSEGHVFIGFSRCRVSKFEEITQCFRCLRFGHPAAKCDSNITCCSNCGQK